MIDHKLSRREFVALAGAGLVAAAGVAPAQSPQRVFAYVGSWTQGPFGVGGGGGISVFSVNLDDGSLEPVSRTGPEFDNMNAGYLCTSPDGRFLYANNEVGNLNGELGAGGGIMSFAIDPDDGSITHVNTQPSMGVNPAYVTIDATGSHVLVSNHGSYNVVVTVVERDGVAEIQKVYDDGTVSIYPVRPDGTLAPASDVAVLERIGGVDPLSQLNPHAHSVNFDPGNRFVLVCDKGADRVYVFEVDLSSGTLSEPAFVSSAPGSAPRHSVFHPRLPYAFVILERIPGVMSLNFDADTGEISEIHTVSTLPDDFEGRNTCADIRVHPNGRFVYGSNRGHDSIAIFALDESTGRLSMTGLVPTEGATPRNFNFDPSGRYVFVCNQGSDSVVTFEADPDDGTLTPVGNVADVLKPACIKFLEV